MSWSRLPPRLREARALRRSRRSWPPRRSPSFSLANAPRISARFFAAASRRSSRVGMLRPSLGIMRTRPMVAVSQVGEWVGLESPQGLPRLPVLWASLPLDEGSSATSSRSDSSRFAAELALWAPPKGAVPAWQRACPPTPLRFARFDGFWTPVRIAHLPMQYNALVNQANGVGGRVRIASRIEAARRGECR